MISSEAPHLVVAALTHPGESGKNNEDRYAVAPLKQESSGKPVLLALVSDGIGGHQAGEVAAQLTVETILKSVSRASGRNPIPQMRSAIAEASRAVSRAARESVERQGMGSTIAAALIIGERLYTANVGDSRIYLLRQGILHRLSTDHTWIQEALDHDVITPEEARNHPNAHVLRRHIGGSQEPQVDFRMHLRPGESDARAQANQGLRLRPGDQLLLCSDGLTDLVEDHEIADIMGDKPPSDCVARLIDLARERGGFDNITAVLLVAPPDFARGVGAGKARWLGGVLIALLALILVVAIALGALWGTGHWPWSVQPGGNPQPSPTAPLPASAAAASPDMLVVPPVTGD
jgi:serine/threonine protein phosphatase PrpC